MNTNSNFTEALLLIDKGNKGFRISLLSGYSQFMELYLKDITDGVFMLLKAKPELNKNINILTSLNYADKNGNNISVTLELFQDYFEYIETVNKIIADNNIEFIGIGF
ncbi:hypothetical protein [Polaribacter glomeratus]|uniref:Uncharacterized protein n=1 Tax=Polaribacter glomeratus TaxID=102 RepID=A0A2S7WI29_9FLAO|nr:hypothetical protein [Polaribacter glomeratus]PQJ76971.1 hypothetical protein BTO16_14015 [Polaribacter glomeratus]TXD67180.1 hypothetical protein ESX12_00900 [Polaribacter glomeratus]